jgi:acyl carrier protein
VHLHYFGEIFIAYQRYLDRMKLPYFLAFLGAPIYNIPMDSEELYLRIREILIEQFDVDESNVSLDANLYDELQIDSIDAVDLLVQIKELTGVKITPEVFREVRTIRDVLNALTTE